MRLDAVASAGMKLSRSKLAKMVKEGSVEVNFVTETNRYGRNRIDTPPLAPAADLPRADRAPAAPPLTRHEFLSTRCDS